MTTDLLWTIAELQARYELEPDLFDVFVEGVFDKAVLQEVQKIKQTGHAFYEIDTVDVPAGILIKYGLTSGNKQRLMALAHEFSLPGALRKQICIVDKDLDHWFVAIENTAILRWTKYCSIDLHFLVSDLVKDVLITVGKSKINDFDALYVSLTETLRCLFALRLADRQCSMMMKWVAKDRYLTRDGDVIRFDLDRYTNALLNKNGFVSRRKEFSDAVFSWLNRLNGDVRQYSRGHDFQWMLAWIIREFKGGKCFASEEAIQGLLVLLARSAETLAEEIQ